MFQFLRRVSGSLLPRPDRPWRDDATSHAPTIGRKRRYSVTEQDDDAVSSAAKRTKSDVVEPVQEEKDVKEVTEGVQEVDLEDEETSQDPPSIQPEGVPLPDSPSESSGPEPESEPAISDVVEESKDEGCADDRHSVASSSPDNEADEEESEETERVPTATVAEDETEDG